MLTHEKLLRVLRELDLSSMSTFEIVTAARSEVSGATTDDVLAALREIEDELVARLEWIRGGKVLH